MKIMTIWILYGFDIFTSRLRYVCDTFAICLRYADDMLMLCLRYVDDILLTIIYIYMIPGSGLVAPHPPEWVGSTQEKGKKQ